jgi:hypothetical protein
MRFAARHRTLSPDPVLQATRLVKTGHNRAWMLAILAGLPLAAPPAHAAFPGTNGLIAYDEGSFNFAIDSVTPQGKSRRFVTKGFEGRGFRVYAADQQPR